MLKDAMVAPKKTGAILPKPEPTVMPTKGRNDLAYAESQRIIVSFLKFTNEIESGGDIYLCLV